MCLMIDIYVLIFDLLEIIFMPAPPLLLLILTSLLRLASTVGPPPSPAIKLSMMVASENTYKYEYK